MQTKQITNLKGFRDFLPQDMRKRMWLRNKMIAIFESWGYEPLETPTVEPLELFEGEIGEDEKLFYKFEDNGERRVALRYDQTVPTARVVGQNYNELTFPFKRYQIQPNFRAEKPQKGRYREFIQADIDIYGIASPIADAECIAVSIDLYKKLGFNNVVVKINSRNLMKGIPYEAISGIDKLEKIGEDGVVADMQNKGISPDDAQKYLDQVKSLQPNEELNIIFDYLKKSGFSENNFQFSPTLARSFSYSEGPIWEVTIPDFDAGSVGGGERYDALVKRITGRDIAATGIAFGFDRTLEAAQLQGLIPNLNTKTILVTIFNQNLLEPALQTAQRLRGSGIAVNLYPDSNTKLDKQLKYADKRGADFAIIIGEEEVSNNQITLKDLASGEQTKLSLEDAIARLTAQ